MKHIQLMLLTSILRSPPSCGSTLKTLAAYVVTFDLMVPFILWFDSLNAVSLCCYLRSCRALHLWFDYLRARSRSKSWHLCSLKDVERTLRDDDKWSGHQYGRARATCGRTCPYWREMQKMLNLSATVLEVKYSMWQNNRKQRNSDAEKQKLHGNIATLENIEHTQLTQHYYPFCVPNDLETFPPTIQLSNLPSRDIDGPSGVLPSIRSTFEGLLDLPLPFNRICGFCHRS